MTGLTPEVMRTAAGAFSAVRRLRKSGFEQAATDALIGTPAPSSAPPPGDIVSRLERLDALHRSGALDDAQYEAAKTALLQEEG
jgi:hypothetical protein